MLGNEPNQGRVISKNHSMKSKLGTVQVWTRGRRGVLRYPRAGRIKGLHCSRDENPRPGGRPITYVPVCVCVLESRCLGVLVWVLWALGALLCVWPPGCPRPLTHPPSHADMTGSCSMGVE